MGTQKLFDYMRRYKLNMPKQLTKLITNKDEVPLENFVNANNYARVTEDGLDLLRKMLVYDKNERITPGEAMQHEYFEPIRRLKAEADNEEDEWELKVSEIGKD